MESLYLVTFLVALVSSGLSGIAGGGGGFIMAPYWLLAGMSPTQGATTGGFMAIGMGASSLAAFRKTDHFPNNKKLTILLTAITIIASIIGALIISQIETGSFKLLLAVITLASLPLLFIKRPTLQISKRLRMAGVGALIAIGLTQLFNLTLLQSTALRRLIGLVQSIVIFIVLASQGNFLALHAIAGITGGSIGSYYGTKFAIKKGENWAKYALGVGGLIGAVALLV